MFLVLYGVKLMLFWVYGLMGLYYDEVPPHRAREICVWDCSIKYTHGFS